MQDFVNKALSLGFTNAVYLKNLKLECEERLREYCNPQGCSHHGNNWVCPPGSGTLSECAEKVSQFQRGILLQSVSTLSLPVLKDTYKSLNFEHNMRLREFIQKIHDEDTNILALTSGGCLFCKICTYPEPCVKPDIRMNSLSAYGIDVGKLCETAKLEYSFSSNKVYYMALVMVD